MTDHQIERRKKVKTSVVAILFFVLLAGAAFYYRVYTQDALDSWKSDKEQEVSLQQQQQQVQAENQRLSDSIEETGKDMVSFTNDKIQYINRASDMSIKYSVRINKLIVSDVWNEGQMSGMTVTVEVQGDEQNVQDYILDYCDTSNANRINCLSYRPADRYVWIKRDIDDQRVLSWFNLDEENQIWEAHEKAATPTRIEGEIPVAEEEDEEDTSWTITTSDMFGPKQVKAYLVVDFLGRN